MEKKKKRCKKIIIFVIKIVGHVFRNDVFFNEI